MTGGRGVATFPLWLEASGLPAHLNEVAKAPYAWGVFRKLIELDLRQNASESGTIEVSLGQLAAATGLDAEKVAKAIKGARKAELLRAFLPDHEEEAALFQLIVPLKVPISPDDLRLRDAELFDGLAWPPRYTVAATTSTDDETPRARIRRVVDLYFDMFSMKMNALILEELQLIADRYDHALIERVFKLARDREVRSLGWILSEIRRETKIREKAEKLRHGE